MDRNKRKIVYLHGLGSSGSSTTAQRLRRAFPKQEVISPDIPVQPELAIQSLRRLAASLYPDDIIIGTSLGAQYAQLFRGWRRILINPSFHTSVHLEEKTGTRQPFHNKRADGAKDYEVSEKLVKKFKQMEAKAFDPKFGIFGKRSDDPSQVQAFFATRDTVVNCKDEYLQHYSRYQDFDGEHRLDPETTLKLIIPAIHQLLEEGN
ncbi:MAG: hypothetical protein K2N05_06930 [Muribaculaceae bacterium]|nr:hypothetical protein [Muribaculaceae bacterium]